MAMERDRAPRPRWNSLQIARDMTLRGMMQRDLAVKAGVSQGTVSRLLRGRPVSTQQVAKVAKALGQKVDRYVEDVIAEPTSTTAEAVA